MVVIVVWYVCVSTSEMRGEGKREREGEGCRVRERDHGKEGRKASELGCHMSSM